MNVRLSTALAALAALVLVITPRAAVAQDGASTTSASRPVQTVRLIGIVRDETNAIPLPGIPVEVVATRQVVFTDVDGRCVLELPVGTHRIKVAMEGYEQKTITVTTGAERTMTVDVGLRETLCGRRNRAVMLRSNSAGLLGARRGSDNPRGW